MEVRMSVLVLTGSARRESFTRRLGEAVAASVPGSELAPRLTVLPFFDQDHETAPPASVEALRAQVDAADAVVVVTPEYNGSIPGLLGNAIDWLSRPYGAGALRGKPVLAVAASPGGAGGARAVVALRTVLGNAGADVVGRPVSVDLVHERLEGDALDALVTELRTALDEGLAQPVAA
jgi:chromate reductase